MIPKLMKFFPPLFFHHKFHKLSQIAMGLNFTNFVEKHIPKRCFVMLTKEASLLLPLIKMIFIDFLNRSLIAIGTRNFLPQITQINTN